MTARAVWHKQQVFMVWRPAGLARPRGLLRLAGKPIRSEMQHCRNMYTCELPVPRWNQGASLQGVEQGLCELRMPV